MAERKAVKGVIDSILQVETVSAEVQKAHVQKIGDDYKVRMLKLALLVALDLSNSSTFHRILLLMLTWAWSTSPSSTSMC